MSIGAHSMQKDDKPLLYIPIEIKERELESKFLVSLDAARRGFRVVMGNQAHVKKLMRKGLLEPGVFFDKSLTPGKEKDFLNFKDQGFEIVSLDEESGLLDFTYDAFIRQRSCADTVNAVSNVFCWGDFDKNAWLEHYPGKKSSIISTGSPRVDFWRQDFEKYYSGDVKGIKERYGSFVLVPTNFPLGNGYMSVEQRIEQGRKNGSIQGKEDEDKLKGLVRDTQIMFDRFVSLLHYLSKSHPDVNFIVRPHPVEKVSSWEYHLSDLPNVFVVYEGGVSKWVRSAKAIIHNGCTTGIEGAFSGIPPIAYTPFPSPVNREVPNSVSKLAHSEEEVSCALSFLLQNGLKEEAEESAARKILEERFSNYAHGPAYSVIVDSIVKLKPHPRKYPRKRIMAFKYVGVYTLHRKMSKITKKETQGWRKFPGLSQEEMETLKSKFCAVKPEFKNVRIKRFLGDMFVFE